MLRLVLVFLLCSSSLFAQKTRPYTTVTAELATKVIEAPAPASPVRLAVVPFTATTTSLQASTQFGEYLTETVVGLLGNRNDKVKLFERTRMDAILHEHEFILTDLMKPAAALKIGQLAPIDALLSGTYTKLKSYVDISARLIDVASGEILVSYNGRVKLDKNIKALFPESEHTEALHAAAPAPVVITIDNSTKGTVTAPVKSKADICKEKVNEFKPRLNDLSGADKIDAVVQEAMKTPFDNLCGQLHYYVMNAFTRYGIDHKGYKPFLLATLDTIAFPANDERAYEIVRFITEDKIVDGNEWQAGFHAVSRVGNYTLSTYVNYLLAKPATDVSISETRIADYFSLASSGKLGLPRALPLETAYFEMMEGLKSNNALSQHVYQTYSTRLQLDDKSKATLFSELHGMYKSETNPTRKTEIMGWICAYANAQEYPKAHEQLYDLAWEFNLTGNETRNAEIRRDFPAADLQVLASRCGARFAKYAMLTPYPSQQEDRINFCVRNRIPVPGVIPTLEEARTILTGSNLDEQLRTMKLLAQMGDAPKKIESSIAGLFGKRSLEDRSKLDEIQTLAITVLGNCRSADTKAIAHMIEVLPHYGNDTEAAKIALVQIGKPAVPQLVARLDKTTDQDGGLQYQLITILGSIGRDAAPAEKSIRRVLEQNRNGDVRYAAEAALQAITER